MMLSESAWDDGAGDQPARRLPVRAPGGALDDRRPLGAHRQRHLAGRARSARTARPTTPPSKGGLLSMGKSLAREVARYGITVNAVCPGLVDTQLIAEHACRGARPVSVPRFR